MLEQLDLWDRSFFKFINVDFSNSFFDMLMPVLRDQTTWYPLYALLLVLAVYKYKAKSIPWVLLAVATIVLSDQFSSTFLKNLFDRIRPCSEPELQGIMILRLGGCPGNASFTSSHAVNHFAIAVYYATTLAGIFKKWRYAFYVWAGLICFAQVYVGVHYPGDVIAGAIIGIGLGSITTFVFQRYFRFQSIKPLCGSSAIKAN